MEFCPNYTCVLKSEVVDGKKMFVAIGRCKSWYCAYCAEKNRQQWRASLLDYANKNSGAWSWFTLTSHANMHKRQDSSYYTLQNISHAWDRLIKRMRRKYGKFQYCRVYEKHKSGAYHLHAIRTGHFDDIKTRNKGKSSEYNDSDWLRKNAVSLGLGYMTHADNIDDRQGLVVGYVTKYMTKIELEDKRHWQRVRRIQTSRGITRVTQEASELSWTVSQALYKDELDYCTVNGIAIMNLTEKRLMTYDDFEDTSVYPK